MKNLFLAGFLLFFGQLAQAQLFSFGLKGGVNTQVNKPKDIILGTGDTTLQLGINNSRFGTQFGAFFRFGGALFIQPEVLFNSNRTDYKVGENSFGEVIKNEKYQYLDIPVLVGLKMGPVRLQGGPVGHYFLNSSSELTDFDGYEARFKQLTWGWQAGLNVGAGRFSVDLRYEGNFSNQGNHITFLGDKYQFGNSRPA